MTERISGTLEQYVLLSLVTIKTPSWTEMIPRNIGTAEEDIGNNCCLMSYGAVKSQLMLYGEIMAVCCEIHTKHISTVCGQNVELLSLKLAVHIVTTGL